MAFLVSCILLLQDRLSAGIQRLYAAAVVAMRVRRKGPEFISLQSLVPARNAFASSGLWLHHSYKPKAGRSKELGKGVHSGWLLPAAPRVTESRKLSFAASLAVQAFKPKASMTCGNRKSALLDVPVRV